MQGQKLVFALEDTLQHFPDHSTKNCTDIVCPLISARSISRPLKVVVLTKEPCPGNLMGKCDESSRKNSQINRIGLCCCEPW